MAKGSGEKERAAGEREKGPEKGKWLEHLRDCAQDGPREDRGRRQPARDSDDRRAAGGGCAGSGAPGRGHVLDRRPGRVAGRALEGRRERARSRGLRATSFCAARAPICAGRFFHRSPPATLVPVHLPCLAEADLIGLQPRMLCAGAVGERPETWEARKARKT